MTRIVKRSVYHDFKSVCLLTLSDSRYRYGKDWEKYKQLVPYRIIPYVY